MLMDVGFTEAAVTVTEQVACFPLPSLALQVMVAVPAATAVTLPVLLTVATLVLLDVHVTLLSVALFGRTVAVSVSLFPVSNESDVLLRVMLVTKTLEGNVIDTGVYLLI